MVKGGLRAQLSPFHCHSGAQRKLRTRNLEIPDSRFARPGMTTDKSLPINILRVEQPLPIHERQPRPALARFDPAVETGLAAGVAGRAGLLDADPDRVLVAI